MAENKRTVRQSRALLDQRAEEANFALQTGVGLEVLGQRVLSAREERYQKLIRSGKTAR
jgi:hypothetical protein